MAGRYEETKAEIDAGIERVRTLITEDNGEAAGELTSEVEKLISGLPKNQQKPYRDALKEAGTPPKVYAPVPLTPTPWDKIDGVRAKVEETAKAMAEGVRFHMKGAEHARSMAESALQIRLRIPNPAGLPDLKCTSQEGRNAQSYMYRLAGEQVEGTVEEKSAAIEALMLSVRGQMMNVLPEYLRSLNERTDEAKKFFPMALEARPEAAPTDAVYAHYYDNGYELPRMTDLEKRVLKYELKKAKQDQDETRVRELESSLGVETEHSTERTLSIDVTKLRGALAGPAKHLKTLAAASPEIKTEVRETAKEARALAEKIIEATQ